MNVQPHAQYLGYDFWVQIMYVVSYDNSLGI